MYQAKRSTPVNYSSVAINGPRRQSASRTTKQNIAAGTMNKWRLRSCRAVDVGKWSVWVSDGLINGVSVRLVDFGRELC
jgi:hypothetical protein